MATQQSAASPRANRGPAAGPDNRRALIAAARQIYADAGMDAPFSAVAKRAGVGQGSLYRHFPDRTALAVAVYEENLAELEAFAQPADVTLDDLFDRVIAQATSSVGFLELIDRHRHDARVEALGARFFEVVQRLVEREQAAGRVGDHVDPGHITLATGMLASEISRTDPDQRDAVARRILTIFGDAFAPGAGRPSP
ncbi:TetR/AcrR family transcriptional regulator [Occultella glacieicola]|uniref:TetR/AcrR family transcriptional regulator n=1 Tax=Occultella glacieicola TaxID=2518684 RepID=A0ABY2EA50_9MICO|nr:TetR/AcrR family transcriptional regulator [Occultella glacieicola]TDE98826.1 TetR/AcrR family transcriptional regulator [Occultella glacieicola]